MPELQDPALKREIDKLATSFLAPGRSSALGLAIVLKDTVSGQLRLMLLNYGTPSKQQAAPVRSDTEYEIGSITKVFTGILLAQAVDAGTVTLDDPLQMYMPEGLQAPTFEGQQITLKQLAVHRSSLPRDANTDSLPDLYAWLNSYDLQVAPGSQYVYSNLGYSLLGDILARLAGTDYSTLEFKDVSQPLGLMDTREALDSDQARRLAQGYTYDGSPAGYFPDSGAMSGAGYLRSTLSDMSRFLVENMLPNSTNMAAAIQLAQTSQAEGRNPVTGTGLGWDIQDPGTPDEVIYKGGGTSGFTSFVSFAADGTWGYVLLSNGQFVADLAPRVQRLLDSR